MTTEALTYLGMVSQMPEDTVVTCHNVSWEDYEELLDQVGEASGLRISFDCGTLQVMTLSSEHEKYTRFIERIVSTISLRLRIRTVSFGSTTIKKRRTGKGGEPDACFYVQSADAIGNRLDLDFETDPAPDIVVEVDVHHDSQPKLPIYAALGVREIWRYDGREMAIYHLRHGDYVKAESSLSLPMLPSRVLTEYLTRLRNEGELDAILAFDHWLQSLQP